LLFLYKYILIKPIKMTKEVHVLIRLSQAEKTELKQRAEKLHISMSGYIRMMTLQN